METAQKVVQHPLAAVAGYLETLLGKLNMELEVAPTDIRSHRDLLQRIIQATDLGLKVTEQDYHLTDADDSDLPEDEEWPDDVEWETVEEVPINLEAVRERIRQRGYKIKISAEDSPRS